MEAIEKLTKYKKALTELLKLRESTAESMADSILNNNEDRMLRCIEKIDAIDEAIEKSKLSIQTLESEIKTL